MVCNMYQFFVKEEQIQGNRIVISGQDVIHIKQVLRMKIGDELAVVNGDNRQDTKEYRCEIQEMLEDEIICTLRFVKEDGVELASKIYLFQGLPKSDKMELIIQKAVELGVHEIIPLSLSRCVVKLEPKKEAAKLVRWQQISEAAAKQSKRRIIPVIKEVMTLKESIRYCDNFQVKVIPYELAEGMEKTKEIIDSLQAGQNIAIFIGPEGGFSETEIKLAMDAGIIPITLGKRILRTETAGFTILSWMMYQLEQ